MTSILGGAGTVVASYLAHAKGTDKLEIYQKRVVDLEKFIRECEGFIKDYGEVVFSLKVCRFLFICKHRSFASHIRYRRRDISIRHAPP